MLSKFFVKILFFIYSKICVFQIHDENFTAIYASSKIKMIEIKKKYLLIVINIYIYLKIFIYLYSYFSSRSNTLFIISKYKLKDKILF